ncbi:MAG TPA: hypothetical protein DCZ97_02985 [Syntrophus sp. (in: bacteria)]|nr:hypothetical protein [Syntrophus sp. (in: bacteria)]
MTDMVIRSRIEPSIKIEAQMLFDGMGLSMSEAIRLVYNRIKITFG